MAKKSVVRTKPLNRKLFMITIPVIVKTAQVPVVCPDCGEKYKLRRKGHVVSQDGITHYDFQCLSCGHRFRTNPKHRKRRRKHV